MENQTDSAWIPARFETNAVVYPGQSRNNIGQNIALDALDTQSYLLTLVTERGNNQKIFVNTAGSQPLYLKLYAMPTTVPTGFTTTLVLEAVNISPNTILNLQAEMLSVNPIICIDCSHDKISGPNPASVDSLEPGDTAIFEWVYEVSGEDGDQFQFTAGLVNGINNVTATATVNQIQMAETAGSALTAEGVINSLLVDNMLIFHSETDQTPDGAYQMYSGTPDGGVDGTLLHFDSGNPADPSFYTQNGTYSIAIPDGLWTASLQLQSEAMPPSLENEGEDLIFHFEDGDGIDPDNSEGDSSRDLTGCGGPSFSEQINSGNNDAEEERSSGNMDLNDNELYMPDDDGDNQIVGLRFTNISIPQGATITSANIKFISDATDSSSISLDIWGQYTDNALQFSSSDNNISSRAKTSAKVTWSNIPPWSNGENSTDTTTPNLSSIVQEIVDRPGWSSGNSMVFIIEGSGTNERVAESHNGDSDDAARLIINYGVMTSPDWQDGSGPHGSGSYYFDGADTCFVSQNDISGSDGNDLEEAPDSTSLWFKTDGTVTSEQYLVYWEGDGTCPNCDYYKISLDSIGRVLFEFKTSNLPGQDITTCRSTNEYDDSQWHHVVAVRKNNPDHSCELYVTNIDGNDAEPMISQSNIGYSTNTINADGKWHVGSNKNENGNWFKGWIDDVIHWNDKELSSTEANDLSHVNYGTGAHQLDIWLDLTDENGSTMQNLYNEIGTEIRFQDPKEFTDNDDNGYGIFNITFNMPQVNVTLGQRLNFSMYYVQSTSTWEALDLDMKIDDETLDPFSSFLEIPFPDNPFPSYFQFDNDNEVEIFVTNLGPNGVYFTNAGTRIAFNGTNGAYAGQIHSINGTDSSFDVLPGRDSIYIPVGSKALMYFYQPTDQPSNEPQTYGNLIPPGTYRTTIWLVGYDDQGESFTRSVIMGSTKVVD